MKSIIVLFCLVIASMAAADDTNNWPRGWPPCQQISGQLTLASQDDPQPLPQIQTSTGAYYLTLYGYPNASQGAAAAQYYLKTTLGYTDGQTITISASRVYIQIGDTVDEVSGVVPGPAGTYGDAYAVGCY